MMNFVYMNETIKSWAALLLCCEGSLSFFLFKVKFYETVDRRTI